jgi:exosortase
LLVFRFFVALTENICPRLQRVLCDRSMIDVAPDTVRAPDVAPSGGGSPIAVRAVVIGGVLLAAVLWSYWTTLLQLAERWSIDPQYSHGFLVPVFAAVILWLKRPTTLVGKPDWRGLVILVVSLLPRWFAARRDQASLDGLCLVGSLLGIALLVGGRELFRWTWPSILFLGFMVPLPFGVTESVAIPLRRFATLGATYLLQTLGYPALADGNIVQIDDLRFDVVHACSGLGMLMTFVALATALALAVAGPKLERILLVVSAIPIAVLANVLRITLTAVAVVSFGLKQHHQTVDMVVGIGLMMPLALVLLWTEYKFLQRLLIPVAAVDPLQVPLSPWMEKKRPSSTAPRWSGS